MEKISSKLGKLGLAILENFVESKLGEKFVTELRGPTDRQIAITWAMQATADRLWKEWADKHQWDAIFNHLPKKKELLADLKQAIRNFYGHPTDTNFAAVLTEILHEHQEFNEDDINIAVNRYMDVLTEELVLADTTFRENRRALADLRSEKLLQIIVESTDRIAKAQPTPPSSVATDLRANQVIQLSPLFISYSHKDGIFVNKMEKHLDARGIRFWRDIHDATAGRLEKIVDRAMQTNPTVLLVLSKDSVQSDWVEHEARMARNLEKELGRDVLCPIALDDSWKNCKWPVRLREQIMEYHVLDFSKWQDDAEFAKMFRKLVDGLDLFYKEGKAEKA